MMKLQNIGLALGLAGLGVLQQVSSASALDWKWSYTTLQGDTASGTLQTNGTAYTPNNTYKISSISGIIKDDNGATYNITGLNTTNKNSNQATPDQSFKFAEDGFSNQITFTDTGILFNTDATNATATAPNTHKYGIIGLFNSKQDSLPYTPGQANIRANGVFSHLTGVQGFTVTATAVPFEFNPTEGAALGVPLFIGLGLLRKKKLAQKSRASKATALVS